MAPIRHHLSPIWKTAFVPEFATGSAAGLPALLRFASVNTRPSTGRTSLGPPSLPRGVRPAGRGNRTAPSLFRPCLTWLVAAVILRVHGRRLSAGVSGPAPPRHFLAGAVTATDKRGPVLRAPAQLEGLGDCGSKAAAADARTLEPTPAEKAVPCYSQDAGQFNLLPRSTSGPKWRLPTTLKRVQCASAISCHLANEDSTVANDLAWPERRLVGKLSGNAAAVQSSLWGTWCSPWNERCYYGFSARALFEYLLDYCSEKWRLAKIKFSIIRN